MNNMSMLENEVVLAVIIGVLGSVSRILLQIATGNKIEDYRRPASLIGLGAIGGWLALQIAGYIPIAIWALGFVAPDVIENLAEVFNPAPTG